MTPKDKWIEENLPQTDNFVRNHVKFLMKLAYEEGQRAKEVPPPRNLKISEP